MSSRVDELKRIAIDLQNASRWFKGWNLSGLQAFIRDEGCCVYCGTPLFEEYNQTASSCIDHLLPRKTYPDLAENVENLVAACTTCNHIKHFYDPSGWNGNYHVITPEVRRDLISKACDDIMRKKKIGDWEKEFPTAKTHFRAALAKYRNCEGC